MNYYLNCDVIGAASRIEYGKKGDRVNVISQDESMALVELAEGEGAIEKFHVRIEKLTTVQTETESESESEENIQLEKPKPERKLTTTKKKSTDHQSSLF
jgi:hypothetical protein